MTRDDILKMAREAGLTIRGHCDETGSTPQELERFYAIVSAQERQKNLAATSEACRAFCKSGAVLMAAIRAKVEQ
jgi:adenosine deaminase